VRRDRSRLERIRDQVRSEISAWRGRRAASNVGEIAGDLQVVGLTRTSLENVIGLPVPQEPGRRAALEPPLPSSRGKLIHSSPRQEVRNVVGGNASRGLRIGEVLNR